MMKQEDFRQYDFTDPMLTPVLSVIKAVDNEDHIHLVIDHSRTTAPLGYIDVEGSAFRWAVEIWLKNNNIPFNLTGQVEKFELFRDGEPLWDILVYGSPVTDIEYFINNLQ